MIRSRTSLTGIFSKGRDPWGPPGYSTNRITRNFPDRLAAEVEDSITNLGSRMLTMPFADTRTNEVYDAVAMGYGELRDQPPMAALPRGFRAHQARCGVREGVV